jgi:acetyltransferase-like isoleucine patch superfamily enzyme
MKLLDLAARAGAGLASRWRNWYFRIRGVRLGGYVWLRAVEIPRNHSQIAIEAGVSLDRGVVLLCSGPSLAEPKIRIGAGTYINRNTMLDAVEELVIGKDCAIGPGCYLTDHDHGIDPALPPLQQPMLGKPTRLGERVWLGANVVVLKGVTIGEGALVGAGSVVTRDLPAACVAVGVPAQVIRTRGG